MIVNLKLEPGDAAKVLRMYANGELDEIFTNMVMAPDNDEKTQDAATEKSPNKTTVMANLGTNTWIPMGKIYPSGKNKLAEVTMDFLSKIDDKAREELTNYSIGNTIRVIKDYGPHATLAHQPEHFHVSSITFIENYNNNLSMKLVDSFIPGAPIDAKICGVYLVANDAIQLEIFIDTNDKNTHGTSG